MRKNNKFRHLESNNDERSWSWSRNIISNGLPKRAFTNPITSSFIFLLDDFFKMGVQSIDSIKNWWRV
jgi:hypothetical protein